MSKTKIAINGKILNVAKKIVSECINIPVEKDDSSKQLIRCIYYLGALDRQAAAERALRVLREQCKTNLAGSVPDKNDIAIIDHCLACIGTLAKYE